MIRPNPFTISSTLNLMATMALLAIFAASPSHAADGAASHAYWDPPHAGMPAIAPPVVRTNNYVDIPASATGPAINPDIGYRTEDFGHGVHMITNGVYQMMAVIHDDGVLIADALPMIGANILAAADALAPGQPITHLIYSHDHVDHIGFAGAVVAAYPAIEIIAHAATAERLARRADPARPAPTRTFDGVDRPLDLTFGGQTLRLTYPGINHSPGNIEIYHAESRTLMLIDVIFPGWMMWRRLALAEDIPGYFKAVRDLNDRYDYRTLIAGHLNRAGTPDDATTTFAFISDLHAAAGAALASTTPGETVAADDLANPWAVFDNYVDRVVIKCVNELTPKWADKLAGFGVFIYDQCLAMEQSLRIDGPSL